MLLQFNFCRMTQREDCNHRCNELQCGISVSCNSTMMIPNKFHPPKSFVFPKSSFGSKNENVRSGQSGVRNTYSWLHYDVSADATLQSGQM